MVSDSPEDSSEFISVSDEALRMLVDNGFEDEALALRSSGSVAKLSAEERRELKKSLNSTTARNRMLVAFVVVGFISSVLLSLYQPMTGMRGQLVGHYREAGCTSEMEGMTADGDIHGIRGIQVSCRVGKDGLVGEKPMGKRVSCPKGTFASGIYGFVDLRVSSLYLICRDESGDATKSFVGGKDAGKSFEIECPPQEALAGVRVRTEEVGVHAVGVLCAPRTDR